MTSRLVRTFCAAARARFALHLALVAVTAFLWVNATLFALRYPLGLWLPGDGLYFVGAVALALTVTVATHAVAPRKGA